MALPSFGFGLETEPLATGAQARGVIGEAFSAELTAAASGLIRLPGWMRIKRDVEGATAQQSATTVHSSYAAHEPRAYSQDGVTFGLLVEPAVTNLLDEHDYTAWTPAGPPLINTVAGPDGVSAAIEVEDDDAGVAENITYAITPGFTALDHTLSAWHFLTAPTPTSQSDLQYDDGLETPTIRLTVVATDWAFSSDTDTEIGDGSFAIIPRGVTVADVGAVSWYGIQLEQRAYPTSFYPASSATPTKAADTLEAVTAAIVPDGFIKFDLTYRPHYAHDETSADHNLWYYDDANRVYFRNSDANIVFRVNGDDVVSGAITFDRHDTLELYFENTTNRRRLVVAGALTGNATVDGTPQPELDANTAPTFTKLLGGSTGPEEGADLLTLDPNIQTFAELADCRALVQMDDITGNRRFRDMLRVFAAQPARVFDVATGIKAALELGTACGFHLDLIGAIVGLPREGDASGGLIDDETYRCYLQIQTVLLLANNRGDAEWTGTTENILSIARKFIGAGGTITYLLLPPYGYKLSLPGVLTVAQIVLLARFLTTATWSAVLGYLEFPLSTDVWGSDALGVADVGTWGSASVVVAGASIWDLVITT